MLSIKNLTIAVLAAAAVIAPASAASAHQTPPTPRYGYFHPAHSHTFTHWGHPSHLRHDARKDTIAVIYLSKNEYIGATTTKARDYTLAVSGPNLAVVPDVRYSLYRDGVYVTSGYTVGGWTPSFTWTHGTDVHRYTYRFAGNAVVEPTTVSLTQ